MYQRYQDLPGVKRCAEHPPNECVGQCIGCGKDLCNLCIAVTAGKVEAYKNFHLSVHVALIRQFYTFYCSSCIDRYRSVGLGNTIFQLLTFPIKYLFFCMYPIVMIPLKILSIFVPSKIKHIFLSDKTRTILETSKAHYQKGKAFHKQGKFDDAVQEFKEALKINPNLEEAYPDLATAHYDLGNIYHNQGKSDDAVQEYKKSLMINPNNAWAHYILGVEYYERGELDNAKQEYQEAIKRHCEQARTALERLEIDTKRHDS